MINYLNDERKRGWLGKSKDFWTNAEEKRGTTLRFVGVAEYADQRARIRSCASLVVDLTIVFNSCQLGNTLATEAA
jgi:hypothetical protein